MKILNMINDTTFILCWMIFMHIVDDYYLQGVLAKMKQKSWWKANASGKLYKHDYIAALICHGFSWSFMIMLPLAISSYNNIYIIFVIVNMIIHCIVDDLKANKLKINLIIDQLIHLIQIIVSWLLHITCVGRHSLC